MSAFRPRGHRRRRERSYASFAFGRRGRRGKYDEAFDYYQKGLDRSANLSTYSRAAHLLWLSGNGVKARQLMQKAINADGPYPENTAWCRAELALMLFHSGALLPADQQIHRGLKEAPENYRVLYVAGKIKAARKQFDQAIDLLKKSVAMNSGRGNHDAMVALGALMRSSEKRRKQTRY